jgi:TPR repeat protein
MQATSTQRVGRILPVAVLAFCSLFLFQDARAAPAERSDKSGKEDRARAQAACEAGEAASCTTLGNTYRSGSGIPRDLPRALDLFRNGCGSGDRDACFNLGLMYENGEGLPKNNSSGAAEFYSKACDARLTGGHSVQARL